MTGAVQRCASSPVPSPRRRAALHQQRREHPLRGTPNLAPNAPPPRGCAMDDALALHAALSSASAPPVARSALAVLSDALRMYGPLDVVVSFNGGKDATVVAHLCRAAFAAHARAAGVAYTPPQAVYWEEEHMFPELDAFVRASAKRYGFNLITYSSGFVEGLQELVSERARPPALVLGTRATDPNGVSATPFEPSSPSWPAFMRINPILNWSYADVWTFLRGNGLAYCSLYDLGYTSLGNSTNSVANPALALEGGGYAPAYLLEDGTKERWSRVPKAKAKQQQQQQQQQPAAQQQQTKAQPQGQEQQPRAAGERVPAALPAAISAHACAGGVLPGPPAGSASCVGLVVVGDEVLRGDVADANSPVVIRACHEAGVTLARVAIVPDALDEVADEVRRQSERCDLVLTSGGVGPTHDDCTLEAVARAFGQRLVRHEGIVAALAKFYSGEGELNAEQLKMADVPEHAEVEFPDQGYPLVRVGNVFVLPGVPRFFSTKAATVLGRYLARKDVHRRVVHVFCEESLVASAITSAAAAAPAAAVGSYPQFGDVAAAAAGHKVYVKVTASCVDKGAADAAVDELVAKMPKGVKYEIVR